MHLPTAWQLAWQYLDTAILPTSDLCASIAAQFCEQLRQPLCLALLRNCMSPYDEAFTAATKLFTAVLLQPKLRGGLKAELGAFFPLLLLRPLEADRSAH